MAISRKGRLLEQACRLAAFWLAIRLSRLRRFDHKHEQEHDYEKEEFLGTGFVFEWPRQQNLMKACQRNGGPATVTTLFPPSHPRN